METEGHTLAGTRADETLVTQQTAGNEKSIFIYFCGRSNTVFQTQM